jgi:hypothetical protein
MPFGTATVITKLGYSIIANRIQTTPTLNAPKYVGMGTGATAAARTAANTDTALSTEVETRATGIESQVTTTETGDTYQVVGVITATAPRSVDEAGLFNASTGPQMFLSATFTVIPLSTNDSLQLTCQCKIS